MRDELITLTTDYVENGEKKEAEGEFFAEQISISRYEFYTSHAANTSPKYIFELDKLDYEMMVKTIDGKEYAPRKLTHNTVQYDILRIYSKNNTIQITVK